MLGSWVRAPSGSQGKKPEGYKHKKILQYVDIVGLFYVSILPRKGNIGHPNSGTIGTVGTVSLLLHTHALMYIAL
ncbi:hypothetical protein DWX51_04845 [Bacteroides uniformis]|jgi:hypothetical protein|nr:hypothetical protein DWX51_04845 [Bacteroides uniformis]RHE09076.1 hypothetical protein DW771_02400 [Bacteroides uniformis]RHE09932.1 hypothetical protein DW770_01580 [Bacteroides uniformis]RHK69332.1 hypothetical protein DW051_15205 [Bacteroides uniformis]